MSVQEENNQTNIVSPRFSEAANPNHPEEEREMTREYAVILPFRYHRIHTEHNVSNKDVDRILRPVLEVHGVKMSDYDPYNLSCKIGEKTIQLSVKDYVRDDEFEGEMRFIREKVSIQKTISISNRCSIKGTEILIDFLKSFQREFECSYFEISPDAFIMKGDFQKFYIDGELMYDPDGAWILEIEDKEAYLQGLENVHK